MSQPLIITIDGPAASGKSSVSRGLAEKLDWVWVSTGAFYRGLAFVAQREDVEPSDIPGLEELCRANFWHIKMSNEDTLVFYRDQDCTREIKSEEVGGWASQISRHESIRSALLGLQRACADNLSGKGLIAEGRDCGTVVFPEASLKIFLTANESRRAERRAKDDDRDVEDVLVAQEKRDAQDSTRASAPMQVAEDGVVVDTSHLDLAGVISLIYEKAQATFSARLDS